MQSAWSSSAGQLGLLPEGNAFLVQHCEWCAGADSTHFAIGTWTTWCIVNSMHPCRQGLSSFVTTSTCTDSASPVPSGHAVTAVREEEHTLAVRLKAVLHVDAAAHDLVVAFKCHVCHPQLALGLGLPEEQCCARGTGAVHLDEEVVKPDCVAAILAEVELQAVLVVGHRGAFYRGLTGASWTYIQVC